MELINIKILILGALWIISILGYFFLFTIVKCANNTYKKLYKDYIEINRKLTELEENYIKLKGKVNEQRRRKYQSANKKVE